MVKVIRTKKGLDIRLQGKADKTKVLASASSKLYAMQPSDFVGVVPKLMVKEGDSVKVGTALFVNKACASVSFPSPVSGRVVSVRRGLRRKIEAVIVESDGKDEAVDFGIRNPMQTAGAEVLEALLQSGLFGFIRQLPYAISARSSSSPRCETCLLQPTLRWSCRDRRRYSKAVWMLCRGWPPYISASE